MHALLLVLLLACGDKAGDDSGTADGGADGGTADGGADGGTADGGADGGAGDGGAGDGGAGDGGAGDGGAGDGGAGDGGTSGASVWDQVDPDHCTDVPGFEGVPGAASYFVGELTPASAPTTGRETWALYANPDWEAAGGGDCVVVWTVTAASADTGACGSCDYGLDISATVDLSATTCDEALYRGDESFTVAYAIDEQPDGTADWYYASSGNPLGSGYVTASGVSYISAASCTWFGR